MLAAAGELVAMWDEDELWGWKAIADVLGRSESWCKFMASEAVVLEQRLPVKKPRHALSKKPRVTASRRAILKWKARWMEGC